MFIEKRNEIDLASIIQNVAKHYFSAEHIYNVVLTKEAQHIDIELAKFLPRYFFDDNVSMPAEIEDACHGLGAWLDIRQNIIFDLLYQFGEESIPVLYPIAFGDYDWTQYKAVRVLCLLARNGIQTDKIINDIAHNLPTFRYEALMPSLEFLSMLGDHPVVISTIEQYFDPEDDIADSLDILELVVKCNPDTAKKHINFLRSVINNDYSNRSPLLDGAVISRDTDGNETANWLDGNAPPEMVYQIKAAYLGYTIDRTNLEFKDFIEYWSVNHSDEQIRKQLLDLLTS